MVGGRGLAPGSSDVFARVRALRAGRRRLTRPGPDRGFPPRCCAPGTARSSASCSRDRAGRLRGFRDGQAEHVYFGVHNRGYRGTTPRELRRRLDKICTEFNTAAAADPRICGHRYLQRRSRRDAAVRQGAACPPVRRRQSQGHDRRAQRRRCSRSALTRVQFTDLELTRRAARASRSSANTTRTGRSPNTSPRSSATPRIRLTDVLSLNHGQCINYHRLPRSPKATTPCIDGKLVPFTEGDRAAVLPERSPALPRRSQTRRRDAGRSRERREQRQ